MKEYDDFDGNKQAHTQSDCLDISLDMFTGRNNGQ